MARSGMACGVKETRRGVLNKTALIEVTVSIRPVAGACSLGPVRWGLSLGPVVPLANSNFTTTNSK